MKAVIVAAGISKRLRSIVKERPKSLLDFGGKSLLERSIEYLRANGVDEVFVVVGYEYQQIVDVLGNSVTYVHNPWFPTTNNMASLWFALPKVMNEEFLYLHADLLYHPQMLDNCLKETEGDIIMLVEKKKCIPEDMKVEVDGDRFIFSSKDIPLDNAFGEWTGITRFKQGSGELMFSEILSLLYKGEFNAYDTLAFSNLAKSEVDIRVMLTDGLPWIEIDFPEDYREAQEKIFPEIERLTN
ncbi:MAG: phosphocholine cytidylyltransferase family protein [Candidatus Thorarchaeota archaeon]